MIWRRIRTRQNAPRMAVIVAVVFAIFSGCQRPADTVIIGSKNFPEQALLGEILAQQIEARTHLHVERRFYLAGTFICQQAILAGRIDAYIEYTGTALTAILHNPVQKDPQSVFRTVQTEYKRRFGLDVLPSLGFNNTFAMVIRGDDARKLHVKTLSEAATYAPRWRPGCGYEFLERPDGYTGLVQTYGLRFGAQPRVLDLGLLYRALLEQQVDIVAGNSTDGLLSARDLVVLDDDKHYFPPYEAVPIARDDTLARYPDFRAAIAELAGQISDADMRRMNYAVAAEDKDIGDVARDFLHSKGLD